MIEILGWKKTEWDFVGKRRIAFAVSGVMVATGLIAGIQLARGKAAMGIDFAGGLSMTFALAEPVEVDRIRQAFSAKGVRETQIQQLQAEKGQRLLIRLREMSEEGLVRKTMEELAGGKPVVIEGTQAVGPAVGKLLRQKAAWAAFWAMIMITIYIWWRFEYRFGVAAAIATIHDVLAVLGIMWVLQKDFTLLTVSALLTIAGYSLTDTVVVYDRIRENLRLRSRDSLEGVINVSINEVLSRTLLTSMTLLPLFALLIYGSEVTYDFSLALVIGLFIGTYSSWYVASPIIVEWDNYKRRKAMEGAISRQQKR